MVLGGGRWIIFVQLYDLSFPLVGCGIKCSALLLFHFRLTLVPRLLHFVDRNHDLRNRKPAGARACVCVFVISSARPTTTAIAGAGHVNSAFRFLLFFQFVVGISWLFIIDKRCLFASQMSQSRLGNNYSWVAVLMTCYTLCVLFTFIYNSVHYRTCPPQSHLQRICSPLLQSIIYLYRGISHDFSNETWPCLIKECFFPHAR